MPPFQALKTLGRLLTEGNLNQDLCTARKMTHCIQLIHWLVPIFQQYNIATYSLGVALSYACALILVRLEGVSLSCYITVRLLLSPVCCTPHREESMLLFSLSSFRQIHLLRSCWKHVWFVYIKHMYHPYLCCSLW